MARLRQWTIVALTGTRCAHAFVNYGNVYPTAYYARDPSNITQKLSYDNSSSITLSPALPVITLDYGTEVAGFPFLVTSSTNSFSQTEIEVKYAEDLVSLKPGSADGPWTFSNGLSNSFRVQTLQIDRPGYFEDFFAQGGQRWQSLRLLSNESVTITSVGFRSTSPHIAVDKLPAHMKTDNPTYNKILDLGGRVAQVACVDAGNAPSTWELTDEGALVRGQTTAQSAKGAILAPANYTLEFSTKILRGGFGWRIASDIVPFGPYFVITVDSSSDSTTSKSATRTNLPPNTLSFNSDWSLVNQSTLETPATLHFPLPISIQAEKWYRVRVSIEESGYRIHLDGHELPLVPLPPPKTNANFGSASRYEGTWGFGGFEDHISLFTNVSVTAANGSLIYANALTAEATLAEYNVAPLETSVCLDGAKRDRLIWIGDFYHTVRVLALSTARWDYILGTIDFVLGFQVDSGPYVGFVPISPNMGSRAEWAAANPSWEGLVDYQDLFLAGVGEYFKYTGDVAGVGKNWGKIKKLAAAKMAFIDPYSGLVAASPQVPFAFNFLGPMNGSAITGLLAFTLRQLVPLAEAMGDDETATQYNETASGLIDAINTHLWNPSLGTYALSVASPGDFSLTGIAWCMLAGAANESQTLSSIQKLEELRFGPGYRTTSSDAESPDYQLAPNPSGFLLEALLQAHHVYSVNSTVAVSHLLDGLWASMVNDDKYYSGASWEYVKPDGSPGIDAFTSLAHPWGAAPSYVLPEYVLGIRPTSAGYKTFVVQPAVGVLGLREVQGRVSTPHGTITASWELEGGRAVVNVDVPEGVDGVFDVPTKWMVEGSNDRKSAVMLSAGKNQLTLISSGSLN